MTAQAAQALRAVAAALARAPRRVLASVAVVLATGAGGVWAVATLAPEPALQAARQVVEAVQPLATPDAAAWPLSGVLAGDALPLFRTDTVRSVDTVPTLLQRLGVQDAAAAEFLRTDALFRAHLLGRAGRSVTAQTHADQTLVKLSARWATDEEAQFKRLVVEKTPQGWASRLESDALQVSHRLAGGTIRSSLFAATDESKIPDAVAVQLAEIFSGDIDFHRALRKGDRFSVVYESLMADGEPLRSGRVLSAEFVNNGKTYQALWFQEPGQKGGYYTAQGQSLRRAYLASPVAFSRVTSGFKMRMHPILKTWRAHLGTDYAAPVGTAVRTVGDGVVEFAGVQNGFGKVVFVRHRNSHTTVYAHLSRIDVKKGQSVSQGQTVGAVGATGWATGPHLHFEFRVNGVHQDPLTIARQSESVPLSAAARPAFDRMVASSQMQLATAALIQVASAQ